MTPFSHQASEVIPVIGLCLEQAQKAAHVFEVYEKLPVKNYVLLLWVSLVQVKMEDYKALAYYHIVIALLGSCPRLSVS